MELPSRPRILTLAVPGLGDALLATPVTHSLKQAFPDAEVSMLVRKGREAVLEGNNDITNVYSVPRRPKLKEELETFRELFRRFDLVVSTSSSDRSFGNCLMAAKRRACVVPPLRLKDWWKHLGIQHKVINDDSIHVVQRNLKLCDALGIKPHRSIIPPRCQTSKEEFRSLLGFDLFEESYLVVHMLPEASYKKWPESFWNELLKELSPHISRIVLTSGPLPEDVENTKRIAKMAPKNVTEVAGRLRFAQLSTLLSESQGFIGPDTSVTHLSAALGVATLALFGPSSAVKWGPWPLNFQRDFSPYSDTAGIQSVGNVSLIKANCFCVPSKNTCTAETPHPAACLAGISPREVLLAWQKLSAGPAATAPCQEARC